MKKMYSRRRSAKCWRKAKLNRIMELSVIRAKNWTDNKRRMKQILSDKQ